MKKNEDDPNIGLVRKHASSILELTDRSGSHASVGDTLETIEHHTLQIFALINASKARNSNDLTITFKINREKLIGILNENRAKHSETHEKACKGYLIYLVQEAEANLKLAQEGRPPKSAGHYTPKSNVSQYDRALGMLALSEDETVSLSAADYARFVEDDWDWKGRWAGESRALIGFVG